MEPDEEAISNVSYDVLPLKVSVDAFSKWQ
jgi:hypothetical protein